ncbi:hypothetical protein [Bacillus sp. UNCCL81]|uniref:hypothetical protein n=1 Tax=Bacillus sp. UNCCL81 TaxID=1502755 RepID=UPI0008EDA8E9|nr:hypothetical protein [Bacillus sp. UNCCL81]SFD48491.1 hypothetical protein SAMN02799633_03928 [Bacillus sp. UNCCL81]
MGYDLNGKYISDDPKMRRHLSEWENAENPCNEHCKKCDETVVHEITSRITDKVVEVHTCVRCGSENLYNKKLYPKRYKLLRELKDLCEDTSSEYHLSFGLVKSVKGFIIICKTTLNIDWQFLNLNGMRTQDSEIANYWKDEIEKYFEGYCTETKVV